MNAFDEDKRLAWAGREVAYEETFARLCAHPISLLLDDARVGPGVRLLDVGTGAGAVAVLALTRHATVTAIDPDPGMCHLAQRAAPAANVSEASLPHLPFADGSFDAVVANFVLNHVGDPHTSAAELVRVAHQGGLVSVSIWPRPLTPLHQLWEDVIDASGVSRLPTAARVPAQLDFERTTAGLGGLLQGAGLTDVEATMVTFTHRVDPQLWWSGPARGVASIGAVVIRQTQETIDVMKSNYDRLSDTYLQPDGMLHLPTAALLASGRVP
jgi:SAM-dependent methyltransferase